MLDRPPSSIATKWSPSRIETLKKLWLDGRSASEIAATLGKEFTRNAVIGKVTRLKLDRPRQTTVGKSQQARRQAGQVRDDHRVRSTIIAERRRTATWENLHSDEAIDPGVDVTHLLGIMDLRHDTCRFPIGDPRSSAFGFCGQPPAPGKPYCSNHCHDAYQRD